MIMEIIHGRVGAKHWEMEFMMENDVRTQCFALTVAVDCDGEG